MKLYINQQNQSFSMERTVSKNSFQIFTLKQYVYNSTKYYIVLQQWVPLRSLRWEELALSLETVEGLLYVMRLERLASLTRRLLNVQSLLHNFTREHLERGTI